METRLLAMNIRCVRHFPVLVLAASGLVLTACAEQGYYGSGRIQGHMVNALSYLNVANNELSQASHDKGGHRVQAMQLINRAINEVNAGIAVGESHGD